MTSNLHHQLAQHEALREHLRADFPEADDETLRDTLEGLSSLPEMIAFVVRSHLEDVALVTALKSRMSDMQERLSRIEARADKKRTLATSVMERADIRKITEPDFTISLRSTPAPLVVTDESTIPQTYWKPQPMKLDRKGLIAALSAGNSIPGAMLANGGVAISVRTR